MNRLTATLVCAIAVCLTVAGLYGCGGGRGNQQSQISLTLWNGEESRSALLVAYQDGGPASPWKALQPAADAELPLAATYSFVSADPSRQYGIAVVTKEHGQPRVRIIHATRDDGSDWMLPGSDPIGCSVMCSALDVPAGSTWRASLYSEGDGNEWCDPIWLHNVPTGTRDLVAAIYKQQGDDHASRLVVQRDHVVTAGDRMDVDFNGPYAFDPKTYAISARDSAGASVATSIGVSLHTSGGVRLQTSTVTGKGRYAALPDSQRDMFDVYCAVAQDSSPTAVRQAIAVFRNPGDKTLGLPGTFGRATVSRTGAVSAPLQLRAMWAPFTGARAYEVTYAPGTITAGKASWTALVSPKWLDATQRTPASLPATVEYLLPDLHTVTGWNAAWNLKRLDPINWTVGAHLYDSNMPHAAAVTNGLLLLNGDHGQFTGARGTCTVTGG